MHLGVTGGNRDHQLDVRQFRSEDGQISAQLGQQDGTHAHVRARQNALDFSRVGLGGRPEIADHPEATRFHGSGFGNPVQKSAPHIIEGVALEHRLLQPRLDHLAEVVARPPQCAIQAKPRYVCNERARSLLRDNDALFRQLPIDLGDGHRCDTKLGSQLSHRRHALARSQLARGRRHRRSDP